MGMVRVEKDREIRLLALAFYQSGKLARPKELPLAFGSTDENRKSGLSCGCDNRLQQDMVGDIEMSEGCAFCLQPCQSIAQRLNVCLPVCSNCGHCYSLSLR